MMCNKEWKYSGKNFKKNKKLDLKKSSFKKVSYLRTDLRFVVREVLRGVGL